MCQTTPSKPPNPNHFLISLQKKLYNQKFSNIYKSQFILTIPAFDCRFEINPFT